MTKPQIRLLVVEDDAVDRMACRRALAHHADFEFIIAEAETGGAGLQLAHEQEPDCVLLDFHLPDMDGLEFLAELRNDLGEITVPVMMLTGADNVSVAVEALKRGAQDYIVKDVNRQYLELLPAVIQRVLRERRTLTEKKRVQAALAGSYADLQRLVAAQDTVRENERKRISRELHDDLQQTLTAIRIKVAVVGKRVTTNLESVVPMLAELDGLALAALVSTRRIVNDLRPLLLEDLGLVPALEALVDQFTQRTGIACHFEAQGDADEQALESQAVVTCLYRVAQESLNNVVKHARASTVQVRLASAGDDGLVLRISDNGRGISAGDQHKLGSFGLLGMRERVRGIGGVLRVDSRPGAGTTVEVVVSAGMEPALVVAQ